MITDAEFDAATPQMHLDAAKVYFYMTSKPLQHFLKQLTVNLKAVNSRPAGEATVMKPYERVVNPQDCRAGMILLINLIFPFQLLTLCM